MEKWVHALLKGQIWLQTFTGRTTTLTIHCQSIDHNLQKECTEPFGLWDRQFAYTVYIDRAVYVYSRITLWKMKKCIIILFDLSQLHVHMTSQLYISHFQSQKKYSTWSLYSQFYKRTSRLEDDRFVNVLNHPGKNSYFSRKVNHTRDDSSCPTLIEFVQK